MAHADLADVATLPRDASAPSNGDITAFSYAVARPPNAGVSALHASVLQPLFLPFPTSLFFLACSVHVLLRHQAEPYLYFSLFAGVHRRAR